MYGDQSGELVFEYWGLKSLTVITALSIIQGHEVKWSAVRRPWNRLPELFPSLLQWQKHLRHGHQKEQIFLLFHKLMVRSFASLSKIESSHMSYSTIIKVIEYRTILHTVAIRWPQNSELQKAFSSKITRSGWMGEFTTCILHHYCNWHIERQS